MFLRFYFTCTHPKVRRTALVGVPQQRETMPVLCVELETDLSQPEWEILQADLLEMGREFEASRGIETFLRHPSFPVDVRHNAKIFREELAQWAADRLA